jgi:hypothetical protein
MALLGDNPGALPSCNPNHDSENRIVEIARRSETGLSELELASNDFRNTGAPETPLLTAAIFSGCTFHTITARLCPP